MEQLVEEFVVYLNIVKKASNNTAQSYRRDLSKMISYMKKREVTRIEDVTEDRLVSYVAELKESNLANASIIRSITSIKSFFRYLVENGNISDNPSETLKAPKAEKNAPRVLSGYEIDALLNQPFSDDPKGKRDKAILELLYATGLKVSEVISIKLENIDMSLSCLRLSDGRVIPYGKKAKEALHSYLFFARDQLLTEGIGEGEDTTVFLNYSGEPMSRQGLWKLIKAYVKKADIDMDITPGTLRHSFISHLIDNGADARVVQEMMGYTDKGTIAKYIKMNQKTHDPYEWARIRN